MKYQIFTNLGKTDIKMTKWLGHVKKVSLMLEALDGFPEKQLEYINSERIAMKMEPEFYLDEIENWYRMQRELLGRPVSEFEMLYPSMFGMKCKIR